MNVRAIDFERGLRRAPRKHIVGLKEGDAYFFKKRSLRYNARTQERNLPKPLVILGTARQHGETPRAVDVAFPAGSVEVIPLGEHRIGGTIMRTLTQMATLSAR